MVIVFHVHCLEASALQGVHMLNEGRVGLPMACALSRFDREDNKENHLQMGFHYAYYGDMSCEYSLLNLF